jgi:uncharacterized membrane protein YbaN (DUF454 family)
MWFKNMLKRIQSSPLILFIALAYFLPCLWILAPAFKELPGLLTSKAFYQRSEAKLSRMFSPKDDPKKLLQDLKNHSEEKKKLQQRFLELKKKQLGQKAQE